MKIFNKKIPVCGHDLFGNRGNVLCFVKPGIQENA
jgi:hypothetical protein